MVSSSDKELIKYQKYQDLLSHYFIKLSQLLSANADPKSISENFEELQQYLELFIGSDPLKAIKKWYNLDDVELRLITIIFIANLNPDSIGPILSLSWYEQGKNFSLERILFLTQQAGSDKNNNIFTLLNTSKAKRWGILKQDDECGFLMSTCRLSSDVFSFLLSPHASYEYVSEFVHSYPANHCRAISCGFPRLFLQGASVVNRLCGLDSQTRTALAAEMASRQSRVWYLILGDENEYAIDDVTTGLRQMIVAEKGNPCVVYWKNLWQSCKQHSAYRALFCLLVHVPKIVIFYDCTNNSDTYQNSLVEQMLCPNMTHTELKLTTPSLESITCAWVSLSQQLLERHQDSIIPLSRDEARTLAQMYPVPISAMSTLMSKAAMAFSDDHLNHLYPILQAQCLALLSEDIGSLAKASKPRYLLNQMTLSGDTQAQLLELLDRIRFSEQLSQATLDYKTGVQALFWGKPGTGKTMAAEALASELKLPFYRVNLANIASKWIGETEKHLATLFDEAQRQNAILLFDEADAIFTKRSEADSSHDKNSNMGVSFLLQRMETFDGILLLTTNFKSNLDDAFLRRFKSVIEFPLPDKSARAELWSKAWLGTIQPEDDIDNKVLAEIFEFSPSQISNIVERAILFSLSINKNIIDKSILAKSIRRELDKQSSGYLANQKMSDWLANI